MGFKCGIVGLPNVGKSTLFNALTQTAAAQAANYPFCTIDPNVGVVNVPDPRLDRLAEMSKSKKVVHAAIEFVDIAGLVKGASQGEGLGNQFLSHIREADAIVQVVRCFEDENVHHVTGSVDPVRDIEIINTELILADIQTIETRLPKVQKESKANPKARDHAAYLETLLGHLRAGTPLSSLPSLEADYIYDLHLLTAKPVIYVFNVDEATLADSTKQDALRALVAPSRSVFVCAQLEDEIKGLEPDDAAELLASYGVSETGLTQLVHVAYDTLGLQSYLTAGVQEIRAWTIKKGSTAPQAAGVIHGDFERGFIAAAIYDYDDLISAGSEQAAKAAGKLRTEGKEYVMRPGDVVEFRFNVSK